MFTLFAPIAALLIVMAGFCLILGAARIGRRLLVVAILGFVLLSLVSSLPEACRNQWFIVGAALLLLPLALLLRGILLKAVWLCLKHSALASYAVACWLCENVLLRFPLVLLPGLSRVIVQIACALFTPSLLVLGVFLAYDHALQAREYLLLSLPLIAILLFGHCGRWRYRRIERKGLAHV